MKSKTLSDLALWSYIIVAIALISLIVFNGCQHTPVKKHGKRQNEMPSRMESCVRGMLKAKVSPSDAREICAQAYNKDRPYNPNCTDRRCHR